jgi:hypothetical protein
MQFPNTKLLTPLLAITQWDTKPQSRKRLSVGGAALGKPIGGIIRTCLLPPVLVELRAVESQARDIEFARRPDEVGDSTGWRVCVWFDEPAQCSVESGTLAVARHALLSEPAGGILGIHS